MASMVVQDGPPPRDACTHRLACSPSSWNCSWPPVLSLPRPAGAAFLNAALLDALPRAHHSPLQAKARLERIAAKHKAATEAAKRRPRRKAASCTAVSKARVPDDAVSLAPASLQRQASLDEDLLLHGLAGALERQRREAEVNSRFASAMAHPQRRSPVGAACCLLFADITARLPCPAVSLVVDGDHCGAHPI